MTEEIIIDGTGCVFYNNGKCNNPNGMACNCINNAVCYFKELKRLKQQHNDDTEEIAKLGLDVAILEQERNELKEKLGTTEIQLANAEFDLHLEEAETRELKQENQRLFNESIELSAKNIEYKSALEEIREILLEHSCADSRTTKYITNKINEVLQ